MSRSPEGLRPHPHSLSPCGRWSMDLLLFLRRRRNVSVIACAAAGGAVSLFVAAEAERILPKQLTNAKLLALRFAEEELAREQQAKEAIWNFGQYNGTSTSYSDADAVFADPETQDGGGPPGSAGHGPTLVDQRSAGTAGVADFYPTPGVWSTFRRDPLRISGWSDWIRDRFFAAAVPAKNQPFSSSAARPAATKRIHDLSIPERVLTEVFGLLQPVQGNKRVESLPLGHLLQQKVVFHALPRRIWDDIARLLLDHTGVGEVMVDHGAAMGDSEQGLAEGEEMAAGEGVVGEGASENEDQLFPGTSSVRSLFAAVAATLQPATADCYRGGTRCIPLSSELCWQGDVLRARKASVPQPGRLRRGRVEFVASGTEEVPAALPELHRFQQCIWGVLTLRSIYVARLLERGVGETFEEPPASSSDSAGGAGLAGRAIALVEFLADTDWPDVRSYVLPQDKVVADFLGRLEALPRAVEFVTGFHRFDPERPWETWAYLLVGSCARITHVQDTRKNGSSAGGKGKGGGAGRGPREGERAGRRGQGGTRRGRTTDLELEQAEEEFEREEESGHEQFTFGNNWLRFIAETRLSDEQLDDATQRLLGGLFLKTLERKSFLDIGSGSGLMSLAALRADAEFVLSLDYDPLSVEATKLARTIWASEGGTGAAMRGNCEGTGGEVIGRGEDSSATQKSAVVFAGRNFPPQLGIDLVTCWKTPEFEGAPPSTDTRETTSQEKNRSGVQKQVWAVVSGSVLDLEFMKNFAGLFDIVYSYGVLHHTGNPLTALRNAVVAMKHPNGVMKCGLYSHEFRDDDSDFRKLVRAYRGEDPFRPSSPVVVHRDLRPSPSRQRPPNRDLPMLQKTLELGMGVSWIMTALLLAAANPFLVPWIKREYGKTFWGDVRDMCGGWPVENVKALDLIDVFVRPWKIFDGERRSVHNGVLPKHCVWGRCGGSRTGVAGSGGEGEVFGGDFSSEDGARGAGAVFAIFGSHLRQECEVLSTSSPLSFVPVSEWSAPSRSA